MLSASVGERTMGSPRRLREVLRQTSCPTAPPSPEISVLFCKSVKVSKCERVKVGRREGARQAWR